MARRKGSRFSCTAGFNRRVGGRNEFERKKILDFSRTPPIRSRRLLIMFLGNVIGKIICCGHLTTAVVKYIRIDEKSILRRHCYISVHYEGKILFHY